MPAIILRPEPYDPDAKDADGDGIVQERTPWERPVGTRLLDFSGAEIERGRSLTERPVGMRVVDKSGRDVAYSPSYERQGIAGRSQLSRLGSPSLAERGSLSVRDIRGPQVVRAPEALVSASFDEDIRRAITLLRPVDERDMRDMSPKQRRAVERAKKIAEKVLSVIDEPDERKIFSLVAGNSFYWATTLADKSGTLTNLLNSILGGAMDADVNPHAIIEDIYQWGGTAALSMPLLLLKERMKLSRQQMNKVADRLKERFSALKLKAGQMNDDLKVRFNAAMNAVRAAWKSRETARVTQIEQLAEIIEDAQDAGRLATIMPDPPDKTRWRRISPAELESFTRRRDPVTLFMRDITPEEYQESMTNSAMNAWRNSFGQAYLIEEAARTEYDPDYFESRWAKNLVEAIDDAPPVGSESRVRPGEKRAYRVDSRNYEVGEVVDFPLISTGATPDLVRGYEGFNDVLGESAPRGTYITFVDAPGVVHPEKEVREFIMSGRFRVVRVDDYSPPWENKPGSPVALRGKRKMVVMEYLGPSLEVQVREMPEAEAENAQRLNRLLPREGAAAPHILGSEDVEARESWDEEELKALIAEVDDVSTRTLLAAAATDAVQTPRIRNRQDLVDVFSALGFTDEQVTTLVRSMGGTLTSEKLMPATTEQLQAMATDPNGAQPINRWQVGEEGKQLLADVQAVGSKVREEVSRRLKARDPELMERLANMERERVRVATEGEERLNQLEFGPTFDAVINAFYIREWGEIGRDMTQAKLDAWWKSIGPVKQRRQMIRDAHRDGFFDPGVGERAVEIVDILDRMDAVHDEMLEEKEKVSVLIREVLNEVRPLGGKFNWSDKTGSLADKGMTGRVGAALDFATSNLPSDLLEELAEDGTLKYGGSFPVTYRRRAQWSPWEGLSLHDAPQSEMNSTALHELGHALGFLSPELALLEHFFLHSRAEQDASTQKYAEGEWAYGDAFSSLYMGKVYQGGKPGAPTEITSMGLEALLAGKTSTIRGGFFPDTEYMDFILGALLSVGKTRIAVSKSKPLPPKPSGRMYEE